LWDNGVLTFIDRSVTTIRGQGVHHAAHSSRWLSACSGTGVAL
jgi:hypothetical protein